MTSMCHIFDVGGHLGQASWPRLEPALCTVSKLRSLKLYCGGERKRFLSTFTNLRTTRTSHILRVTASSHSVLGSFFLCSQRQVEMNSSSSNIASAEGECDERSRTSVVAQSHEIQRGGVLLPFGGKAFVLAFATTEESWLSLSHQWTCSLV